MADQTITAADVMIKEEGVEIRVLALGESCTAMQPLKKLSTDNKYYLAQSDNDEDDAEAEYLSLLPGSSFTIGIKKGQVDPGFTVTAAEQYVLSANEGKVALIGDMASTNYRTDLMEGVDASTANIKINATGVQK